MRALAAERDASSVNPATDETVTTTTTTAATTTAAIASESKDSGTQKKPAKSTKTRKVAHIVDKMLFNYRNIGEDCVVYYYYYYFITIIIITTAVA